MKSSSQLVRELQALQMLEDGGSNIGMHAKSIRRNLVAALAVSVAHDEAIVRAAEAARKFNASPHGGAQTEYGRGSPSAAAAAGAQAVRKEREVQREMHDIRHYPFNAADFLVGTKPLAWGFDPANGRDHSAFAFVSGDRIGKTDHISKLKDHASRLTELLFPKDDKVRRTVEPTPPPEQKPFFKQKPSFKVESFGHGMVTLSGVTPGDLTEELAVRLIKDVEDGSIYVGKVYTSSGDSAQGKYGEGPAAARRAAADFVGSTGPTVATPEGDRGPAVYGSMGSASNGHETVNFDRTISTEHMRAVDFVPKPADREWHITIDLGGQVDKLVVIDDGTETLDCTFGYIAGCVASRFGRDYADAILCKLKAWRKERDNATPASSGAIH